MVSSYESRLGTAPEEAIKAPCIVASTTNITLSGEQTIGSTAVVAGDRVLVAGQTDASENGIYACSTGSWSRATDWNANDDVVNGQLVVETATRTIYQASFSGDFSLNVTNVTFYPTGIGGLDGGDVSTIAYATDTGAADAYVITLDPAITAYAAGQTFRAKITNTNTGASTMAVNGLPAVDIKKPNGADPEAGDLLAGGVYEFTHDGTNLQLQTGAIDSKDMLHVTGGAAGTVSDYLDRLEGVAGYTALRGLTPQNGKRYYVKYRAAVGDKGHGVFRAVTGAAASTYTDDGGTVILPTGGDGSAAFLREYQGELFVPWFEGANFGAQIQAAHDAAASTGAIINANDLTFAKTLGSTVTISKPVTIYFGATHIDFAANQIKIQSSAARLIGVGRVNETQSPTKFYYSGTAECVLIKHATTSTPLFGNLVKDIEIDAYGSAITGGSAVGIASYGTRHAQYENVFIYNFQSGTGMYFTGNGPGDGFGATCIITKPSVSTCAYGIYVGSAGGSHATHGLVIGGNLFGSTTGFDTASESWRLIDVDMGGTPGVKVRAAADDTVLMGLRFEASSSEIVIDSGADRTQVIAPSFINHQGSGAEITDNGTYTIIVAPATYTDSKYMAIRAMKYYSNAGVTATLAAGAGEDVLTMAAGTYLVAVRQSTGGTGWRATAIVQSTGAALVVDTIGSANVTVTSTGSSLRLVNSHGSTSQALQWSVMKMEGATQF